MVIEITQLHCDTSFDFLDFHSRPQLYEKSKHSALNFSQSSQSTWMKVWVFPQPVGLLKVMLSLWRAIRIKKRKELCLRYFIINNKKNNFDTFESMSLKLEMMLDMTKFYGMIPV